jgi:beta-galactosidase
MPLIGRERDAELWLGFANLGGVVLVTSPAGYRTEHNTWVQGPAPGPLASLIGATVLEYDVLSPESPAVLAFDDGDFPVSSYAGLLQLTGAEAIASYTDQFYAGTPAATRAQVGEGAAYYLGAISTPQCVDHILGRALHEAGVTPSPFALPGVEVVPLKVEKEWIELSFVLNHTADAVELPLPDRTTCHDLLKGRNHTGTVPLEPYGVALLRV